MHDLMNVLLLLFAAEMAADGWTTWQVIRFGGREVIPWLQWLMARLGTYRALLLAKVTPVAVVIYMAAWGYNGSKLDAQTLAWICAGYAVVIANNYRALQKQKEQ